MTIRIAMWSGPRNISTAMMRSFENRPDCAVSDEPFYAAYLAETGLDHPMRGQDLIPHRVNQAGGGEIGCVERLVDHRAVGAVLEAAHHRRGDVARTRPHGDADGGNSDGAHRAASSSFRAS